MCDTQSPARGNNPALTNSQGSSSHAGFRSASPQGTGAATTGPSLAGWPRQIAWDEFRDVNHRPQGVNEDAQIYAELVPGRFRYVQEDGQYRLGEMAMRLTVRRGRSWVVRSRKSDALLSHEQGHFDITGLIYRGMLPELRTLRESSPRRLAAELRRILREYNTETQQFSNLYDEESETNHGRDAGRQQEWESLIRDCIRNNTPLTSAP